LLSVEKAMPQELGPGHEAEKARYGSVDIASMNALVVLWHAPFALMLLVSFMVVGLTML
jgi:hypothetical protein